MSIMSFQHQLRDSDLPWHLKAFALLLTTWSCGKAEDCYPGVKLLAKKTGQTERTIKRNIKALVQSGWISTVTRNDRTTFLFHKPYTSVSDTHVQNGHPCPNTERVGVTSMSTLDTHVMESGHSCPPYPLLEETNEEKRSVASRARGEHTLRNATRAFNSQEGESVKVHGVSGSRSEQSQDSAQETPQEIWAQLWGRQAYPRCLEGRERGVALDVIAWLLVKRRESPDGITSPGRLAKYILGDYEQGTKTPYAHWTRETLSKLKEGLSYAMARKESETAREGQMRASKVSSGDVFMDQLRELAKTSVPHANTLREMEAPPVPEVVVDKEERRRRMQELQAILADDEDLTGGMEV